MFDQNVTSNAICCGQVGKACETSQSCSASCHFLYQRRFRSSARNVPGFGWRNAFGSNHPPPGVVNQANACRCVAQLESNRKICQTPSRSHLHNTVIAATSRSSLSSKTVKSSPTWLPSKTKRFTEPFCFLRHPGANHPHLNRFILHSIQELSSSTSGRWSTSSRSSTIRWATQLLDAVKNKKVQVGDDLIRDAVKNKTEQIVHHSLSFIDGSPRHHNSPVGNLPVERFHSSL